MTRNFMEMLAVMQAQGRMVCVGLDSKLSNIPAAVRHEFTEDTMTTFNIGNVNATNDIAGAYKLNAAFYQSQGEGGENALERTIRHINETTPEIPVILDSKDTDIGNTNAEYVEMAFGRFGADAVTVNPYFGGESLKPFLEMKDKGIIVLCKTSNSGSDEFQNLDVSGPAGFAGAIPLCKYVARRVAEAWNKNGNCGLVVGAMYPHELREVREIVGDMPILIPGVGFQQKGVPLEEQVKQVVSAGKDSRSAGMIINAGRSIIFASSGKDFAEAARRETLKLQNLINQFR